MGPFSSRGSPLPGKCLSPPHLAGSATGSASDAEGIQKPEDLPYFQCPGAQVRSGERNPPLMKHKLSEDQERRPKARG